MIAKLLIHEERVFSCQDSALNEKESCVEKEEIPSIEQENVKEDINVQTKRVYSKDVTKKQGYKWMKWIPWILLLIVGWKLKTGFKYIKDLFSIR